MRRYIVVYIGIFLCLWSIPYSMYFGGTIPLHPAAQRRLDSLTFSQSAFFRGGRGLLRVPYWFGKVAPCSEEKVWSKGVFRILCFCSFSLLSNTRGKSPVALLASRKLASYFLAGATYLLDWRRSLAFICQGPKPDTLSP